MYDRNKGVQSIIDAYKNNDPTERGRNTGAVFNCKTGKITHNNTICGAIGGGCGWYYLIEFYYPVYEGDKYIGFMEGDLGFQEVGL